MATSKTPLVLIIRDGWGENPNPEHDAFNAVKLAATPVADRLAQQWPTTLIRTCGEDVGLPEATMGNSEVGHQNIGAGRVVEQELRRISRAISDGSFFHNGALLGAFAHAHKKGGSVHLLGLVSDGRVHSDFEHLEALIEMASRVGIAPSNLIVHAITDGRDTGPRTGLGFIERLEATLNAGGTRRGWIGTVCGRFYAMDRDLRWDRVALAWAGLTARKACVKRTGGLNATVREAETAAEAVQNYYENPTDENRRGDEFIEPTVINTPDDVHPTISHDDAVIFFNFRGDRPRELTRVFVYDDVHFSDVKGGGFDRGPRLRDIYFCTMTEYEQGLPVSAVAFDKPKKLPEILGEVITGAGRTQLRCAETEKYPHVTFFFNDYREEPFYQERRVLLPSPRDVNTYDQKPEMSAEGVCAAVLKTLRSKRNCEDLIVVNFANADMVGHTGDLEAAIRAVETVDECVGRIEKRTLERRGAMIVTADHGNAEQMWDPANDCPHTAHTTYDVPLVVVNATPPVGTDAAATNTLRSGGRLADIAPTALEIMGITKPHAMTGTSLLAAATTGATSS